MVLLKEILILKLRAWNKDQKKFDENMKDEEKMSNFLNCYFSAYSTLNKDEKDIFDATFVDRLTDQEIIGKYKTYSKHITQVRKSAIIKFCLKSGLDKFVDLIK